MADSLDEGLPQTDVFKKTESLRMLVELKDIWCLLSYTECFRDFTVLVFVSSSFEVS